MAEPTPDPEVLRGPWVDQHCHLGLEPRDDGPDPSTPTTQQVLADARAHGVVAMVTVGTDAASSTVALELAERTEHVWATAGVHPHDAVEGTGALREVLAAQRAREPGRSPLVAVGECGLDYHYDHSPREVQRAVFAEQVQLAHDLDLPLVIHTRAAWDDTFAVLDEVGVPERTVLHCFTGGPREAERCLERGLVLSFSGIVTFPRAPELREAAACTPLGSLMVETDSPFLAPVPHRGRPNRPALVGLVGAAVAAAKALSVAEVAETTTATATRFYGLDR